MLLLSYLPGGLVLLHALLALYFIMVIILLLDELYSQRYSIPIAPDAQRANPMRPIRA